MLRPSQEGREGPNAELCLPLQLLAVRVFVPGEHVLFLQTSGEVHSVLDCYLLTPTNPYAYLRGRSEASLYTLTCKN